MRYWRRKIAALLCIALVIMPVSAGLAAPADGEYVINNNGFPRTAGEVQMQIVWDAPRSARPMASFTDGLEIIPGNGNVATGQTITINDQGTELLHQTVVVVGDVVGTGMAGLPQLIRMAQALSGTEPFEGIYARAADISGDGSFGIEDMVLAAQEFAELQAATAEHRIVPQLVPLKYGSTSVGQMLLYFVDGVTDLPWLSVDMAELYWDKDVAWYDDLGVESTRGGAVTTWTRPNGSSVTFDCENSVIHFPDYDDFMTPDGAGTVLDVLQSPQVLDEAGQYIRRAPGSFGRSGRSVTVDAASYGIDFIVQNGRGYLPMQTFEDIFLSSLEVHWLYNGESVIQADNAILPNPDQYYAVEPSLRSEELTEYNYQELCLLLDLVYGLKEQHDIPSFDTLFEQTELKERLLNRDAVVSDTALNELCLGYLADLHSSFIYPSPHAGQDADIRTDNVSSSVLYSDKEMERLELIRSEAYPDGVPGYEEVGETAYVTFDEFIWPHETDYYASGTQNLDHAPEDTVGLIMYAHERITREDSPIKNVVLDLSNNYGGSTDAAIYVIGWFLGGEADMSINSTMTGAQATTKYEVDVNADGYFNAEDSVAKYNRYCLISQNSFSCGNLVPAAFKASNQVTLLGRNTGGGSCIIRTCSTADGTLFRVSGPLRTSMIANGAFYDVDRGIAPDVPLTKFETFYDRQMVNHVIEELH